MNPKILPAAITAVVGFALGWAVKPSGSSTSGSSDTSGESLNGKGNGGAPDRPDRPPLIMPSRASQRPAPSSDVASTPDINRAWKNIATAAEKSRIQRMSEAMGLSEEQEAQVADIPEKEHVGFKDLLHTGKTPAELLQDAALAEKEANDAMQKVLDPQQLAGLDAYKSRQKDNDIESKAQSVLGDVITNTDLSAEQRERALEVLRKSSAVDYDKRPDGWDLMSENYSILGTKTSGVIDSAELGAAFTSPDGPTDPAAMQQKMQEAQRRTIQNRMTQMSGILTPAQLAQYRTTLESRLNLAKSVPALPPSR